MAGPKRFRLLLSTGNNTFASSKSWISTQQQPAAKWWMEVLESLELSYYFLLRNRRLGGDYYSRNNHQQLDINIDTTAAEGGWRR